MCGNHHTVIDDDSESYTVARLKEIKANHEQRYANGQEPSGDLVSRLLQTINGPFNGPVVITQGQMGGQTANQINNYGLMSRRISPASASALISELQKYSSEEFYIHVIAHDREALDFTESLSSILVDAKWKSLGWGVVDRQPPLEWGIVLSVPEVRPSFKYLLKWLIGNGFETKGHISPSRDSNHIMINIGPNR